LSGGNYSLFPKRQFFNTTFEKQGGNCLEFGQWQLRALLANILVGTPCRENRCFPGFSPKAKNPPLTAHASCIAIGVVFK
jgi:hypothetical protein